jgi:hypothetical protein
MKSWMCSLFTWLQQEIKYYFATGVRMDIKFPVALLWNSVYIIIIVVVVVVVVVVIVAVVFADPCFSLKKKYHLFFSHREHYSPSVCCCSHVNVNHNFTRSCRWCGTFRRLMYSSASSTSFLYSDCDRVAVTTIWRICHI